MKPRSVVVPLLVLTAIVCAQIVRSRYTPKPHDFSQEDCTGCHLTVPEKDEEGPLRLVASVNTLCARCHGDLVRGYSHPVEIRPRKTRVPEDLPLSWSGRVTCVTCHDIHGSPTTAFGERSYLLRRPVRGRYFCTSCHGGDPLREIAENESHASSMGLAHANRFQASDDAEDWSDMDDLSRQCMSCHDGISGTAVQAYVKSGIWDHESATDHPIGVDYKEARMRDKTLKPLPADSPLRLFNGRLGCGTCHDPYSRIPMQLVMSNERSRMCLSCHNK